MKKIVFLFMAMLLMPLAVSAEEKAKEEVNVYMFWGIECSYCDTAFQYFDSIEEEYGDKFNLVGYEVWENTDNLDLLTQVGEAMDKDVQGGVPLIIIGNTLWTGYTSDYDQEFIDKIEEEYNKEEQARYDISTFVDEKYFDAATISSKLDNADSTNEDKEESNNIILLIITILVIGGIVGLILYSRKTT